MALLSALVKLPGVIILASIAVYLAWRREWRGWFTVRWAIIVYSWTALALYAVPHFIVT
ncbi:MAG: hypothetical protein J2P52_00410 [Blastocatellia bacterium]|nr:hypothetical protein [Blastocatellia bacterium]